MLFCKLFLLEIYTHLLCDFLLIKHDLSPNFAYSELLSLVSSVSWLIIFIIPITKLVISYLTSSHLSCLNSVTGRMRRRPSFKRNLWRHGSDRWPLSRARTVHKGELQIVMWLVRWVERDIYSFIIHFTHCQLYSHWLRTYN